MTPEEEKALLVLAARMEDEMAFIQTLSEKLPNFKTRSAKWDATITKLLQRRRGDRSKLSGAALVEEVALDLAKWRRRQLREESLAWDDAWEHALREVAAELNLSASTIADWYKGKSRRKRKKRERDS